MKKIAFLLLFCIIVVPVCLSAAEPIRVGCVSLQKVLNESEAGKKAKHDLESLIKSKQAIIDEKSKVIEKLRSELEKQASVLSPEARKSREEELEKLLREYQRIVQDSQTEVKKKEVELTNAIAKEIHETIARTGQEEGYTLIMECSKEKETVLYSSKEIDITDKIIKKYNASKTKPKKK